MKLDRQKLINVGLRSFYDSTHAHGVDLVQELGKNSIDQAMKTTTTSMPHSVFVTGYPTFSS